PALPSPILLPARPGLDPAGYFVEQRLRPGIRDLRNRPRVAWHALPLRSGQYGDARRNLCRSFLRVFALRETTERDVRFKLQPRRCLAVLPSTSGVVTAHSRHEFPHRGFSTGHATLRDVDGSGFRPCKEH